MSTELRNSQTESHELLRSIIIFCQNKQLKGSVKEPNMFHNYETEIITHKASDAAEYIELFGSSARDHHAGRIQCYYLNVR